MKKAIIILMMFFAVIQIVIAMPDVCLDENEELFSLENVIITFRIDNSYNVIESGNNVVIDFREVKEEQCFSSEGDIYVGETLAFDISIDEGVKEQLIIGDGTVMTLILDVSETEEPILAQASFEGKECYGFNFKGSAVSIKGNVYVNLPLCMLGEGENDVLSICKKIPECLNTILPPDNYIDIGLRYHYNGITYAIAIESDEPESPLHIAKGGRIYGVVLVEPDDPEAAPLRIKTSSGIKALRRY